MTAPDATPQDEPADPETERAARHGRMLAELAEIGMTLARDLSAHAVAVARAGIDPGQIFARISRAVRLTIALEAKLCDAHRVRREALDAAAERAREQARDLRWRKINHRMDDVYAAVEEGIEAEAPEHETERLLEALDERLTDPPDKEDFADLPVEALIARIRKDLGLPVLARDASAEDVAGDTDETARANDVAAPQTFAVPTSDTGARAMGLAQAGDFRGGGP